MIRTQDLAVQFVDFVLSGDPNPKALRLDDTRMLQCLLINAGLGCPRNLHDPERTGCEDSFFLELSRDQTFFLQKLAEFVFYGGKIVTAKRSSVSREVAIMVDGEKSDFPGGVFRRAIT